jgi:hypothetical protein
MAVDLAISVRNELMARIMHFRGDIGISGFVGFPEVTEEVFAPPYEGSQ